MIFIAVYDMFPFVKLLKPEGKRAIYVLYTIIHVTINNI